MSTSDRVVVLEAAGAAALVVGLVALVSPHDVWMQGFGLHPLWVPVIVLSARYGPRGMFPALGLACAGLIALGLGTGESLDGLGARTRSASDLLALATTVLVAWVAMAHESRIGRSAERLNEATEAQRQAEDTVRALHASLAYMRGRHDRLDLSLSLWRHVASRIEHGDAQEAARAALELCEIRAGASAGMIHLLDGNHLSPLASRGTWSAGLADPYRPEVDPTVRAAILTRQVTPAGPGAAETDCDLAVPICDEDNDAILGVMALRGVPPSHMHAAELRDVGILAQWLAPVMARQLRRQFGTALGALQAMPGENK